MGILEELEKRRKLAKRGGASTAKKTPAWSQADQRKLEEFTESNDHTQARLFIARKMGWTQLCKVLAAVIELRDAADFRKAGVKVSDSGRHAIMQIGDRASVVIQKRMEEEHPRLWNRMRDVL